MSIFLLLAFGGRPLEVFILAETGHYQLLTSPEVISELRKLLLGKFGWSVSETRKAIRRIVKISEIIKTQSKIQASKDPDDDKILACAVDGGADYIISGDKRHLLPLKKFRGIPITTVGYFLNEEIWKLSR